MKKLATTFLLLAFCATAAQAANQVRISQVYGGGGATSGSPAYNVDYVEIFNSGPTPVNIGGWTIEYGSATGLWGSSSGNIFTFPADTIIQPCKYILTSHGTPGAFGAPLAPAADFAGTLTISATSGKVALFSAVNTNLACGAELPGTLVDKVSFGSANCPEGTNAGGPTNLSGVVRNGGGMTDTDNNLADFAVVLTPTPRNSQSAANAECLATPAAPSTWGAVKSIYRN